MADDPATAAEYPPSTAHAEGSESPQCGWQCADASQTISAMAPAMTAKSIAGATRERVQSGRLSGGTSCWCTKMSEHPVDETRSIAPIVVAASREPERICHLMSSCSAASD
jgi:hypothetical protein